MPNQWRPTIWIQTQNLWCNMELVLRFLQFTNQNAVQSYTSFRKRLPRTSKLPKWIFILRWRKKSARLRNWRLYLGVQYYKRLMDPRLNNDNSKVLTLLLHPWWYGLCIFRIRWSIILVQHRIAGCSKLDKIAIRLKHLVVQTNTRKRIIAKVQPSGYSYR